MLTMSNGDPRHKPSRPGLGDAPNGSQKLLASHSGLLQRLFGPGRDKLVAEIG